MSEGRLVLRVVRSTADKRPSKAIALGAEVISIGRAEDNTIVLADPNASRHHARLVPSSGGWLIVDLGSTCGTFVNGEKVERRILAAGDTITIGTSRLVVERPEEASPVASTRPGTRVEEKTKPGRAPALPVPPDRTVVPSPPPPVPPPPAAPAPPPAAAKPPAPPAKDFALRTLIKIDVPAEAAAPAGPRCMRCGKPALPGAGYCPYCGLPIPATRGELDQARRPAPPSPQASPSPRAERIVIPRARRRGVRVAAGLGALAVVVAGVAYVVGSGLVDVGRLLGAMRSAPAAESRPALPIPPRVEPTAATTATSAPSAPVPVPAGPVSPDRPPLRPLAQASAFLDPASGGAVTLSDGTEVRVPAGGVEARSTLTVARVDLPGDGLRSGRIYEIRTDAPALRAPAKLTFRLERGAGTRVPTPPMSPRSARPPARLVTFDDMKGWVEVPSRFDAARGTIEAEVAHFSDYAVAENEWAGWIDMIDSSYAAIPVPYYSQGNSGWCWAAATRMMFKAYGREVDIWDIARILRAPKKRGLKLADIWDGVYVKMFRDRSLATEHSGRGWFDGDELTGYLIYQLLCGRPVWLALPNCGHAVVVTGFDRQRLYFNDPADDNIPLEFLGLPRPGGTHKLNPTSLTWPQWAKLLTTKRYLGLGLWHTMVVRDTELSKKPPVTLTVETDDSIKVAIAPGSSVFNALMFDATPLGYAFTGMSEVVAGIPPAIPCRSDVLSSVKVKAANSTSSPVAVDLDLRLDGAEIKTVRGVTLPANTSNLDVKLIGDDEALAFLPRRMALGDHTLELTMRQAGGDVLDASSMTFPLGPAQPAAPKAQRLGEKVKLEWEVNPEAREGLAPIEYAVWRDGAEVHRTMTTDWEDTPPAGEDRPDYRVEAIVASQPVLTSIKSRSAQWPEAPQPTAVIPARDGPKLVLQQVSVSVLDPDSRAMVSGTSQTTSTSHWEVEGERFTFASIKDGFGLDVTWSRLPTVLIAQNAYPLKVTVRTKGGPRVAEVAVTPVLDTAAWRIEPAAADPAVVRVGVSAYRLTVGAASGPPAAREGVMKLEVIPVGRGASIMDGHVMPGTGSGRFFTGAKPDQYDVFAVELQLNGMATVSYIYVPEGSPLLAANR